jgi:hypothetical protein
MSSMAIASERAGKKPAPLAYFLGFVFVFFIGILVFCYAVTKRTNPVFLDEHGRPAAASSGHSH